MSRGRLGSWGQESHRDLYDRVIRSLNAVAARMMQPSTHQLVQGLRFLR